MTAEEKDRCVEVLFYLYFNNVNENVLGKATFWNTINNLCQIYDIDSLSISKAIRILLISENIPSDKEMYYLLNKLGLTVRPLNKISGVYWQKQVKFQEEITAGKIPTIHRRITDIVMKRSMRDFIYAMYNFFSIFSNIDITLLEKNL